MKLSQRLKELAQDLRDKATACEKSRNIYTEMLDKARCQGKVSAYAHAAELVGRLITAAEIAEQKH